MSILVFVSWDSVTKLPQIEWLKQQKAIISQFCKIEYFLINIFNWKMIALKYCLGLCHTLGASLVAQTVKHLTAMRETWVQSLGWEYPLEEEMAAHSSTLTWRILWTEEPGGLQSMGSQRVGQNWETSLHFTSWWIMTFTRKLRKIKRQQWISNFSSRIWRDLTSSLSNL